MGNLKRWKTLGGGEFFKWDEGITLEGVWQGTQPGKFGDNGRVEQPDGAVKIFRISAGLRDLVRVKPGTEVLVSCLGKRQAKNGNAFWAFKIQVAEDAEMVETEPDDHDDEVPF